MSFFKTNSRIIQFANIVKTTEKDIHDLISSLCTDETLLPCKVVIVEPNNNNQPYPTAFALYNDNNIAGLVYYYIDEIIQQYGHPNETMKAFKNKCPEVKITLIPNEKEDQIEENAKKHITHYYSSEISFAPYNIGDVLYRISDRKPYTLKGVNYIGIVFRSNDNGEECLVSNVGAIKTLFIPENELKTFTTASNRSIILQTSADIFLLV
jgi:hypothetical protein